MEMIKKYIAWILLLLVVIIAIMVGRSIWFSLQDTFTEIKAQTEKMAMLTERDKRMWEMVDSLDQIIRDLSEEEQRLTQEREHLERKIGELLKKQEDLNYNLQRIQVQDSIIINRDSTVTVIDSMNNALEAEVGIFRANYDSLWSEYKVLHEKYID